MSGLLSDKDNGLEPIPWQNEYQNYLYSNPGTIMFSIGRIGHGFIRGYFGTTSKLAALAHARECFGILQLNHYWRPISYRNRPSWLDQQAGLACATPLRQFDFRFTDDWNEAVGRVEWGTLETRFARLGRDLIIPVFATLRPPIQITPSFATLTLWIGFSLNGV